MDGYFKVHRKILESQVFAHQTALKIWIWCLAKVSYKDRFVPLKIGKGETTVKLLPGQFIFGRFKAEEELGIDGSTIYKWMQKFASPEFDMISIESNNQYSIVSVCKWQEYQVIEEEKEQPSNNQVTTKEQPSNTYNKDNTDKKKEEVISFSLFWEPYHILTKLRKTDKVAAEKYWMKLNNEERQKAIDNIKPYYDSIDKKIYVKKARTYLADKNFNDEFTKTYKIERVAVPIPDNEKLIPNPEWEEPKRFSHVRNF
jgi:hypothetical protein